MRTYISKPFEAEQFADFKHLPPGVTNAPCPVQMPTTTCWADKPHYHTANRKIVVVALGEWVLYRDGKVIQHMDDVGFRRDFVEDSAGNRIAEPRLPRNQEELLAKGMFMGEPSRKSRKARPSVDD